MVLNFDNTETLVGNLTCGLFPPIQNEIENYLDNDFLKFSISRSISIVHSGGARGARKQWRLMT